MSNEDEHYVLAKIEPHYGQDMNDRVRQAVEDSNEWFPAFKHTQDPLTMCLWSLCLCGESGELANKIKKYVRGSLTLEEVIPQAAEELVDTLVYAFNMAAVLDIDLEEEYDRKRAINDERFGSH